MERNHLPRHNSVDEILAIIDQGLADSEELSEAYKANFVETGELPEVKRPGEIGGVAILGYQAKVQ